MSEPEKKQVRMSAVQRKAAKLQATKQLRDVTISLIEDQGLVLKDGIEILNRLHEEREEVIDVNRELKVFWSEGLAALQRVMERDYGYMPTKPQVNPFTGEKMPVSYLTIDLGPGESVNVQKGEFTLPGIEGVLSPLFSQAQPMRLVLTGEVKRKDEPIFQELANAVVKEVQTNSIYRQKMLEMEFAYNRRAEKDVLQVPKVVTPPPMLPGDLILPKLTAGYVDLELFQFVKHVEANRANGLPMNRKVLLAGPYGTGKTLTAGVLANVSRASGWTFLWYKPSSSDTINPFDCLKQILEVAQLPHLQPAIVFMEDVDQLLGRQRDGLVNEVVNTLDGIMGKDSEVLFVATTNTPEALDPVTLRRFDLLVSFELPDADAASRLVRLYAGKLLPASADLDEVGEVLKGHAPSVIASAVEASRRAAIYRAHDLGIDPLMVPEDVLIAASARAEHVQLINRPPRVDRDPVEQVADSLRHIGAAVAGTSNGHATPTSVRELPRTTT